MDSGEEKSYPNTSISNVDRGTSDSLLSSKREGNPSTGRKRSVASIKKDSSFIFTRRTLKRRETETELAVERLKQSLPTYTLQEIREFRLPHHEALLVNLRDAGLRSTASYIEQLIKYQEEMIRDTNHPYIITLPELKSSNSILDFLSAGLQTAEIYNKENSFEKECEEFLKLAMHFAFGDFNWWWLGEAMLLMSIRVSSQYSSLQGKYEALSRYAYARYLVVNVKDHIKAIHHLKITRELSRNRTWTTKNLFPVKAPLYIETNELLFNCCLHKARGLMEKGDYKTAAEAAEEAQRSAGIACLLNGQSLALLIKGICETQLEESREATKSLLKAFNLQKRFGSVEGKCEVRLQLAIAALMRRNTKLALSLLMDTKLDAEDYELPKYLAETYRQLGKYILTTGEPDKAFPVFKEANKIFTDNNITGPSVEEVRSLEAITYGLQILPTYVEILKKAEIKKPDFLKNMMILVNWKEDRIQFWDDDIFCNVSFSEPDADFITRHLTELHAASSSAYCLEKQVVKIRRI